MKKEINFYQEIVSEHRLQENGDVRFPFILLNSYKTKCVKVRKA